MYVKIEESRRKRGRDKIFGSSGAFLFACDSRSCGRDRDGRSFGADLLIRTESRLPVLTREKAPSYVCE